MNNTNNFKGDIDKTLSELRVTNTLKESTINRITQGRTRIRPSYKIHLAIAAALLLVVIMPKLPILNRLNNYQYKNNTSEDTPKILRLDPEKAGKDNNLPSDSTIVPNEAYSVFFDSIEAAQLNFSYPILIPSYMPENMKISSIHGTGPTEGEFQNLYLLYGTDTKTVLISIKANVEINDLTVYDEISLRGSRGYLRSDTMVNKNIELLWYENNLLYSIQGFASEDEAIRIAESMK